MKKQGAVYNISDCGTFSSKLIETKLGIVEYYLSEEGKDQKPVVMASHGGLGGIDQARIMLDWINQGKFRLLCISRPGYLLTPISSGEDIVSQARLFDSLLTELKIQRISLVASSAGGPAAFTFALLYPEKMTGLIAIDCVTGPYQVQKTIGPITATLFLSAPGARLLHTMGRIKPAWFARILLKSSGSLYPNQLEDQVRFITRNKAMQRTMLSFLLTLSPYRQRKRGTENDLKQLKNMKRIDLGSIDTPTLVIHGTKDADVGFWDGVYAFEHINNATKFWIENGTHLGFWFSTESHEVQQSAREFLDRIIPTVPVEVYQ